MSVTKSAFITGITGQDGSYLAELLLSKNYDVYGLVRRKSLVSLDNVEHLRDQIHFIDGDLTDQGSLVRALQISKPDEVYNLAAQSFVGSSFNQPLLTSDINAMGCLKLLEAVRQLVPSARFYQAGTSEMFGNAVTPMQNEETPFKPRSPYGVSKTFAHYATVNYRESYGLHASNGILFNHESPRRGEEFVTRKITKGLAKIYHNSMAPKIRLGNLDAKRDWGFAGDYVKAMWLMLQQDEPDDYVIATGETHSIRDFLKEAFSHAFEIGNYEDWVEIDPKFYRPAEVNVLLGDASKARKKLGWEPEVSFPELVRRMVDSDIEKAE